MSTSPPSSGATSKPSKKTKEACGKLNPEDGTLQLHFCRIDNSNKNVPRKVRQMRIINYAPRHEEVWGSGGAAPPFLTLAVDVVSGQLHAPTALSVGKQ
jgi:hypothetical protein